MIFDAINLDWVALALGTIGTAVWAHRGRWEHTAAYWWLASSVVWMVYAYRAGQQALGFRDALNVGLYLYGAWRWTQQPRASGSADIGESMLQTVGADPDNNGDGAGGA